MSIENGHKFILKDFDVLFRKLLERNNQQLIDQFYVSDNVRFRRTETEGRPMVERYFTYKQVIDGRVLEIERHINEADYLHARNAAVSSLSKVRFEIPGAEPDTRWNVDFLLTHPGGDIYFSLAEVECPTGTDCEILPEISDYVGYAVPETSSHLFTNKRLSNPHYAQTFLRNHFKLSKHCYE